MSERINVSNLFSSEEAKVYLKLDNPPKYYPESEIFMGSINNQDTIKLQNKGIEELKKQVEQLYKEYQNQKRIERGIKSYLKKNGSDYGELTLEDIIKYRSGTEKAKIAIGKILEKDEGKIGDENYDKIRETMEEEIVRLQNAEDTFTSDSQSFHESQVAIYALLSELKGLLKGGRKKNRDLILKYIQQIRDNNSILNKQIEDLEGDQKKIQEVAKRYINNIISGDKAIESAFKQLDQGARSSGQFAFAMGEIGIRKTDEGQVEVTFRGKEKSSSITIPDLNLNNFDLTDNNRQKATEAIKTGLQKLQTEFKNARSNTIAFLKDLEENVDKKRKIKNRLTPVIAQLFAIETSLLKTEGVSDKAFRARRNAYGRGLNDILTSILYSEENINGILSNQDGITLKKGIIVEVPKKFEEGVSSGVYGIINEGFHVANVKELNARLMGDRKEPLIECAQEGTAQGRISITYNIELTEDSNWEEEEKNLINKLTGKKITLKALKQKQKLLKDSKQRKEINRTIKEVERAKKEYEVLHQKATKNIKSAISIKNTTGKIDNDFKIGEYYVAFSDKLISDPSNTKITSGSSVLNDLDLYLKGFGENGNFKESSDFYSLLMFIMLNSGPVSKYQGQLNKGNITSLFEGIISSSIGEIAFSMSSFIRSKANASTSNTLFIVSANEGNIFYSKMLENTIASLVNTINNLENSTTSSKIGGVKVDYTPTYLKATSLLNVANSKYYQTGLQTKGEESQASGPAWTYVAQAVARTTKLEIALDVAQYFK